LGAMLAFEVVLVGSFVRAGWAFFSSVGPRPIWRKARLGKEVGEGITGSEICVGEFSNSAPSVCVETVAETRMNSRG